MMRTFTNEEWIVECQMRLARAFDRRDDVESFRASLATVAREMRAGNADAAARVAFPLALVHHLPELNRLVCRAVTTRDELSFRGAEREAGELIANSMDDLNRACADCARLAEELARARAPQEWCNAHG